MERAVSHDTKMTAHFKANEKYPEAKHLLYQDFPSKFVWKAKTREWTPRKQDFSIGQMYYAGPRAGEHFYLRTLLTVIKGAISFESLCTFGDYVCVSYREACLMHRANGKSRGTAVQTAQLPCRVYCALLSLTFITNFFVF